ncbi:MAG TPA: HAMP domain-containing sensor histidine kinase [Flavipsychrobacter sp.]|nr:HAMP domain-containing sensor histidine kinase [Flavipsychrobacter sp.]
MRQYINWKSYLILVALCIVTASIYYTSQLAGKLAKEERKKVEQLIDGIKTMQKSANNQEVDFASNVITQNTTIPLIMTNENGKILFFNNIDTAHTTNSQKLLQDRLRQFKAEHAPIVSNWGLGVNYVYYGESYLLTELRYFPYVQLSIIIVFLFVVLLALSSAHRSLQNQVWVGLSKETAHQLGTPLSSIEAWMELLKEQGGNNDAVTEMQKDLDRLKLVADRFSKVGSAPQLEEQDLIPHMRDMTSYMQRRAPSKVTISLHSNEEEIPVHISGPLFDWVIENLIRNALDAMAGKGSIDIQITNHPQHVWIDVSDDGKGIPKHQIKKIFAPGFTTKKRGWGLGLSLSKRIIEQYHHGSLFVKHSEVGKGTTFRIVLRR